MIGSSVKEFMKELNLMYSDLRDLSKLQIKKIKEWETKKWREEISDKTSLSIYKNRKFEMKEEKLYDDNPSSLIFYKARTNNLDLNNRKRFKNEDTKCVMCEYEVEDLNPFYSMVYRLFGYTSKGTFIPKTLYRKQRSLNWTATM